MNRPTYWLAALTIIALAGCAAGQVGRGPAAQPAAPAKQQAAQPTPPLPAGKEITMPSGLKYLDLVVGDGPIAEDGMTASVHYTGWLTDGTKFDSSVDRGQPFPFQLGAGQVIRGWDEGVKGMRVGGKRKLTIPPELGYGERGAGGVIPPGATLVFDVELLSVK
jgi:FKBP-type peptidyl-prolyl cis-trans isomerase